MCRIRYENTFHRWCASAWHLRATAETYGAPHPYLSPQDPTTLITTYYASGTSASMLIMVLLSDPEPWTPVGNQAPKSSPRKLASNVQPIIHNII